MKKPRFFRLPPPGFTLMEVLIAILMFGIIVTTVFASYRSVFFSAPMIESSIDLYEMSGTCLGRIALDLRSIYIAQPPAYKKPEFDAPPDPYRVVARGDGDGSGNTPWLRFASLGHLSFEQSTREGIAEIVYYDHPVGDGVFQLKRSDSLYPYPPFEVDGWDPILCEGIKKLKITYFDREGNDYDYWDSESDAFDYATPVSVNLLIEIAQNGTTSVFETRVTLPVVREGLE
ncbi:MAG: prepilin-type N-terminal cleavage/methylation domain-containing protein [Deltaproteobacteria bacterium]|nr:prepilin-type N-terminal cleavage/methylation domain-containing protein [Deltaproteobacteria bacterium]MBW2614261.1 prepilin-type N-terminal cleavage/methylation domain-containing protein [Deltaproteobacteria bacterium]MBW2634317.1 prepilin-type N-terminal cleavage/methylation domain-containing protein [Deltaproteobacteria bacterium]